MPKAAVSVASGCSRFLSSPSQTREAMPSAVRSPRGESGTSLPRIMMSDASEVSAPVQCRLPCWSIRTAYALAFFLATGTGRSTGGNSAGAAAAQARTLRPPCGLHSKRPLQATQAPDPIRQSTPPSFSPSKGSTDPPQLPIHEAYPVTKTGGFHWASSLATNVSKRLFQSGCQRESAGRFSIISCAPHRMRAASSSAETVPSG